MKKSSALPDLSLLSLKPEPTSATLWEVLARPDVKNSKDPNCERHGPQTNVDDPTNCAQEGYLMCRNDIPVFPGRAGTAPSKLGESVKVETEDGLRVLKALPSRTKAKQQIRMRNFEQANEVWVNSYFNKLCVQGQDTIIDDNGKTKEVDRGILYEKFKESLIEWTDWYYLDKEEVLGRRDTVEKKNAYNTDKAAGKTPLNRGLLFVRYFGTEAEKEEAHMPSVGVFDGEYLYVTLVCANGSKGYGRKLMEMAHSLAGELGVSTVVLATLPDPNTAGFYLMKMGYKFASRHGSYIDVKEWIEPNPEKPDQMKFVPDKNVTDDLEEMLRDVVHERVKDDGDSSKRNKRSAEHDSTRLLQRDEKYAKIDGGEEEKESAATMGTPISRFTFGNF
tara:strand:+ start:2537 stop:3709 length:1173 start_codon:yes stop_codon:yes gene_type:complete